MITHAFTARSCLLRVTPTTRSLRSDLRCLHHVTLLRLRSPHVLCRHPAIFRIYPTFPFLTITHYVRYHSHAFHCLLRVVVHTYPHTHHVALHWFVALTCDSAFFPVAFVVVCVIYYVVALPSFDLPPRCSISTHRTAISLRCYPGWTLRVDLPHTFGPFVTLRSLLRVWLRSTARYFTPTYVVCDSLICGSFVCCLPLPPIR